MEATKRRPRFFLASVAAALVTIILPYVNFLLDSSGIYLFGRPDRAGRAAEFFFLLIMPGILFSFVALWYAITRVLDLFEILSKLSFFIGCMSLSLLGASLSSIDRYSSFGLKSAVFDFFLTLGILLLCLGLGSVTWWVVAFGRSRKSIKSGAEIIEA